MTFRQLPVFCEGRGGGVLTKYGHARILANADIYGRSQTTAFSREIKASCLYPYLVDTGKTFKPLG